MIKDMENDPPPSYNSVVRGCTTGPTNRRTVTDSAPPIRSGTTNYHIDDRPQICDSTDSKEKEALKISNQGESPSVAEPESTSDNYCREMEEPRTGLWNRFKKCLENVALIVIQILD